MEMYENNHAETILTGEPLKQNILKTMTLSFNDFLTDIYGERKRSSEILTDLFAMAEGGAGFFTKQFTPPRQLFPMQTIECSSLAVDILSMSDQ